jgi:hypothetical protein
MNWGNFAAQRFDFRWMAIPSGETRHGGNMAL